jgi:hypothetical protein
MRGLSVLDMLIILAVAALLVFAGSRDFVRYQGRSIAPSPPATSPAGS